MVRPGRAHAAGTGDAPQNSALACDNRPKQGYGTCYLAYNNTNRPRRTRGRDLDRQRSTDGTGQTPDAWSARVPWLVQPPPPGGAGTCGRVVVAYGWRP
jgi:hypothetical protein